MSIRLILCDWEGCISEPGGGTVPWPIDKIAELSKIIAKMRANPKYPAFALCTGRQFPYGEAALQALDAMWDGVPSILENGSGLYYPGTKKIIWHPAITSEASRIMAEVRIYVTDLVEEMGVDIERGKEFCVSLNPPDGECIDRLYEQVTHRMNSLLDFIEVRRSLSAVDITPRGVNKGSAVQFLSEVTGISLEHVVGIGDSSNDLPMLGLVGHPACPANAEREVLRIAEYVSCYRITDGVIDIIDHYCGIGNA